MKQIKETIKKAVAQARQSGLSIEYTPKEDHFCLKISSPIGNGGNRNYIFNYIPYTDLNGVDDKTLFERFKQLANHEVNLFTFKN